LWEVLEIEATMSKSSFIHVCYHSVSECHITFVNVVFSLVWFTAQHHWLPGNSLALHHV
jgi:hypothetical protein